MIVNFTSCVFAIIKNENKQKEKNKVQCSTYNMIFIL